MSFIAYVSILFFDFLVVGNELKAVALFLPWKTTNTTDPKTTSAASVELDKKESGGVLKEAEAGSRDTIVIERLPENFGLNERATTGAKEPDSSRISSQVDEKANLTLNPEALKFLESLPAPIYSIVAIGPSRVGKSFWMGAFARHLLNDTTSVPFEVSDTSESCTEGVWFLPINLKDSMFDFSTKTVVTRPPEAAGKVTTSTKTSSVKTKNVNKNSRAAMPGNSRYDREKSSQPDRPNRNNENDIKPNKSRGTLLLFDVQGSDKGDVNDLILTDQLSAFIALVSSRILFFLERHIETSKLMFYDRVADMAPLF